MPNGINRFVKKISKLKSESFTNELLKTMDKFLNNEKLKVKLDRNHLIMKCDKDELKIVLAEHGNISYEMKRNDISTMGQYSVYKNGYFVKLIYEEPSIYDIDNYYSKNIVRKEIFKVFDKEGVEQFRRITSKLDNYYEDKETGKIILHEPDIMENYKETSYIWRVNGKYIIKRVVKNYIYPDGTPAFIDIKNSDNCFIRYQLTNNDSKEIPNWGNFYGIDKDVFLNYFQKKSSIDDIVDNFYSKKYYKSCSIEF